MGRERKPTGRPSSDAVRLGNPTPPHPLADGTQRRGSETPAHIHVARNRISPTSRDIPSSGAWDIPLRVAKATEAVLIKFEPEALAAIDRVRGEVPRAVWVKRLCSDAVAAHDGLADAHVAATVVGLRVEHPKISPAERLRQAAAEMPEAAKFGERGGR